MSRARSHFHSLPSTLPSVSHATWRSETQSLLRSFVPTDGGTTPYCHRPRQCFAGENKVASMLTVLHCHCSPSNQATRIHCFLLHTRFYRPPFSPTLLLAIPRYCTSVTMRQHPPDSCKRPQCHLLVVLTLSSFFVFDARSLCSERALSVSWFSSMDLLRF